MDTKQIHNSTLVAADAKWLFRQAYDFWRYANDHTRTPGSRDRNRRKFVEAIRQLLPLVALDELVGAFRGPYGTSAENQEAIDAIQFLAGNVKAGGTPNVVGVNADSLTRHLTAATAELVEALKLLKPTPAAEPIADGTPQPLPPY